MLEARTALRPSTRPRSAWAWAWAIALLSGCLDFHALRERAADPDGGANDSGPARDSGSPSDSSVTAGSDGSAGRAVTEAGTAGRDAGENRPPLAAIDFPRSGATVRDRIRVRGSARDPDGDAITALTLTTGAATIEALETLQPDGSFVAEVELADGAQSIELAIEDERGARASTTVGPVERTGYRFAIPAAAVLDGAGERALAMDALDRTLVAIDLESGAREVLVPGSTEPADSFVHLGRDLDLALDAPRNRALVVGSAIGGLRAVSLADGASTQLTPDATTTRRVVVDPDRDRALVLPGGSTEIAAVPLAGGSPEPLEGSGLELVRPQDLALDLSRNRIIVSDSALGALVAVDLDTGVRSLLSGEERGRGPVPLAIRDLVIDAARDRALVVQERMGRFVILEVQLESGDRRVAADLEIGDDPELRGVDGPALFYDPDREALFVLSDEGRLAAVHLEPGTRRIVADSTVGAGPDIRIAALGFDAGAQQAIVIGAGGLYAIDPVSGDRTLISSADRGEGPAFGSLYAVAVDASDRAAWVLASQGLFRVDLANGDRERRSGGTTGSGPTLGFGAQLLLDLERNRAIAVAGNAVHDLFAIDLESGDRSVLASASVGTGPAIDFDAVALDPERNRLLAVGDDKLVAVDPVTSDRTLIADDDRGEGPDFGALVSLALDPYTGRVLVADAGANAVLAVDPESGNRSVVTGPQVGDGPLSLTVLGQLAVDQARDQLLLIDGEKLLAIELIARGRAVVSDQHRGELHATAVLHDATQHDALYLANAADPFGVLHLDLTTGERTQITTDGVLALALRQGRARDELLVLEPSPSTAGDGGALYRIAAEGEATELLASSARGEGPLQKPRDVAWDGTRERILLADAALRALLALDPDSGTRTVLSGAGAGEGAELSAFAALCVDAPRDRALAISDDRIVAIDLESGDRTLLAEPGGSGEAALVYPTAIACDPDGTRAFIADDDRHELAALDLDSGELTFHPLPRHAPVTGPHPPATIDLDPQLQVLYVLSPAIPSGLLALDLVTYEHVLLAGSGP